MNRLDKIMRQIYPVQPFFLCKTRRYFKVREGGAPIVHYYSFYADDGPDKPIIAVPDGCVDMLFTVSGGNPDGFLHGSVKKGTEIDVIESGCEYFGVRFVPGFIPKKFGVTIRDLVESKYSLTDAPCGKELIEKIAEAGSFEKRIQTLGAFMGNEWRHRDFAQAIIAEIAAKKGMIKVSELSEKTLYSERYINIILTNELGLSPKTFAGFVRFQSVLAEINRLGTKELSDTALRWGYYDQSHFTKDFKKFTSYAPMEYTKAIDQPNYYGKIQYLTN